LEDVATPEEVQWFVGELPLPIKLTWRFVGGASLQPLHGASPRSGRPQVMCLPRGSTPAEAGKHPVLWGRWPTPQISPSRPAWSGWRRHSGRRRLVER
jgi:hypothetical protein